jgi:hypothetical protein
MERVYTVKYFFEKKIQFISVLNFPEADNHLSLLNILKSSV